MGYSRNLNVLRCPPRNAAGFSLIEVIVAVAILGVVTMGMMGMMSNLARENRALSDKVDAIQLEHHLFKTLSIGPFCSCLLNGRTVNTDTGNTLIQLSRIPKRFTGTCAPDPESHLEVDTFADGARLRVASIGIGNFESIVPAAGVYSGDVVISFDAASLIRPLKPIRFKTQVQLNLTDPSNARRIESCGATIDASSQPVVGVVMAQPHYFPVAFVDVALPPGKFSQPPIVVLQPRWNVFSSTAPMTTTSFWVKNVTPTSFRIHWHGPSVFNPRYPIVHPAIEPGLPIDWVAYPRL